MTTTARRPACRPSASTEEGLVVARPIEGRSSSRSMMPVVISFGRVAGMLATRPVRQPQFAKMSPPMIAAKVPTVAEAKPSELAPTAPASSSAPPTAAAVPNPPTNPVGSMIPNQSSVPKTGAKSHAPSRMKTPHWAMNMPVENDHIVLAPARTCRSKTMVKGIAAKTTAMRIVV